MTQEFLDEMAYAVQTAKAMSQELRDARNIMAIGLEAKKLNVTLRAISYFILADENARADILNIAKSLKDKEVVQFVKEFENG